MAWLSLLWLVAVFLLMLWLRRWIEAHVQGAAYLISGHPTVAVWIFFLVFLPGTLVHELSHWLVATVLGVRTGRIVLWPQAKRDGSLWLGAVQVGRADPLRSSLIGLAPLISGSLLVTLIGAHLQLGLLGDALASGRWDLVWDGLAHSMSLPDFWLWVYLLFAISNRMLPSPSDREPWRPVLVFLALLAALVLAAGWTPHVTPQMGDTLLEVVGFLIYAFTLTVVINVVMVLVIGLVESIAVVVRRERVPYS